jgi:hypothetical protein
LLGWARLGLRWRRRGILKRELEICNEERVGICTCQHIKTRTSKSSKPKECIHMLYN